MSSATASTPVAAVESTTFRKDCCGTPQPDKRLKARDSREERARQAQRRYRDRQKGKLEEYKQKVEQLTAQCAELMREKENVQSRYKLLEQATAAQRQQRGATPQQADQGGAASPELHRIVANFANLVYQGQQQQRQVNQAEVAQWGSDDYFRLHQDYVAQLALCLLQGAEVSGSVENKRLEALVLAMRAVVRAMDRPLHRSIMLKFKQYAADQSSPAPGDHWQQVLAATGLTALQKQEIHAAWLKLLADMSRILPQRWSILGILQTATQAESAMAVDQVHLQRFNATLQLHQQLHNSLKEESRAVHNFKTSFIVEAFTPIQEARCTNPRIHSQIQLQPARKRQRLCTCSSELSVFQGSKQRPASTGPGLLSSLVNVIIATPALFGVIKFFARKYMKSHATKGGIPWDAIVQELQASEVQQVKAEVEDLAMQYPDYFTRPFHGYVEGNMGWLPGYELEPATSAMFRMVYKDEQLTPQQAQDRSRGVVTQRIRDYIVQHSLADVREILDVGCASGLSTRYLAEAWPEAHAVGLDLSPYFVAVAELRERQASHQQASQSHRRIQYLHRNVEDSGFPDASFDLISVQYVIHELPVAVTNRCLAECRRLLRPGGMLAMVDVNPRAEVLKTLPKPVALLKAAMEPWMDEYISLDAHAALLEAGFRDIVIESINPRHQVMLATA
ncbi:hypothetical protein WJX72_002117 [[Myrmecia] bisecta]|uniref:Methyltransferase type 11 domain-containing protein n=1 Tax=[Myrmecia] bisecta TaxID=41462 RepID=A0AAW1R4W4_9CHLO